MKKVFRIVDEYGAHARPLEKLVNYFGNFQSEINVMFGYQVVNGKSILYLMSLALKKDDVFTIDAKGVDEKEVFEGLKAFNQSLNTPLFVNVD